MSVNIPKDPLSVETTHGTPKFDTSQPATPSISAKDSLESFSTSGLSTRLTQESAAPELPQGEKQSIVDAHRMLNEALRGFRKHLSASDQANLESRKKMGQLALEQASEMSKIIQEKATAIAKLQEEINKNLGDLKKQLKEMEELLKKQQKGIDGINSGNGLEKEQFEKLTRAYDDYVAKLKSIGAIDLGNGKFLIPEAPTPSDPNDKEGHEKKAERDKFVKDKFNEFTREYQQAVTEFNNYFPDRLDQINKYNATVNAYNQKAAEYNKAVNEFIIKHNLSDYLKERNITIPQLTFVNERNTSGYKDRFDSPSPISSIPATVESYPPPDYARSIGQTGPPPFIKTQ